MKPSLAHEGIGTDIIEIARIKDAMQRHGSRFLKRIFSDKEISYCMHYRDSACRFAGRFAAKEAIAKALGTGIGAELGWKDISIENSASGQPIVHFSKKVNKTLGPIVVLLSISHCHSYATATALIRR